MLTTKQIGPVGSTLGDRGWIVGTLACSTVLLFATWALGVGLIDDAYIFLRYARNLAEGNGPVFNVGERVEGYSSPLWTFALGGLGVVFPDFERLAFGCGLLCGVGILVVTIRGLRITAPSLDVVSLLILGIGLATAPILFFASGSGMDSALFGFLVTASLVSILQDQQTDRISTKTAILLAVATLARTEGVILAAFALFVCRRKHRVIATIMGLGAWVMLLLVIRW
ncbi:MAG: hypothetical protein AABZ47_03470, partial [Planctomycetota bacterium]